MPLALMTHNRATAQNFAFSPKTPLVKGHWRRQWHPSRSEHRPIYIDAHLKGDPDKPFWPPRQKLYVVAR